METTGLDSIDNEPTELSIIRYSDRHQLTLQVMPQFPYRASPEALKITGKTLGDLLSGESQDVVVKKVNRFLSDGNPDISKICLVGHNILNFDKLFLHQMYRKQNETFQPSLFLDTLHASKLVLNSHFKFTHTERIIIHQIIQNY
jgi:DNA polymerase III alpha subunit (gram-positive type)